MKKGISLITLVITIVVVIILAAAVIIALGQNNPVQNARVATVSQTKDAIEAGVLMYASNVKANTLGELSTAQILIGDESYKIVDGSTATITVDGNEKTLYKISTSKAKEKLSVEMKEEENGAWYINSNGRVYLIYNNEASIPSYLKENGEIVTSISSFVTYAGSVTQAQDTQNGQEEPEVQTVKYTASDIATLSTEAEKQSVIGKSVSLTSTNGWTDWKVFGSDGTNIMLITGDYVPVSYLPSGHGFGSGSYNTTYCVNSSTSRSDLLTKLTTASTFNGFKDSAGKVTEARIPTIQDFALSYNAVEHSGTTYIDSSHTSGYPLIQKVYYKAGANSGYNVAAGSSTVTSNDTVPADSYWTNYGLPRTETNYGNLWVIEDGTKAYAYWLASASSGSADDVLDVRYSGYVDCNSYASTDRGLRPVVFLASNVKLVQNIDGTYTLE